jgi:hypothetical protein
MSVSTSLGRRGFMALACGLLVPAPERVRAYSFGSLYANFVEFECGRIVELDHVGDFAQTDLFGLVPAGAVGRVRSVDHHYRTSREIAAGFRVRRIVAGGHEAWYEGGRVVQTTTVDDTVSVLLVPPGGFWRKA